MPRPGRKASTTDRGLGWTHRQHRERLIRCHTDGDLCWWCNRPMFKAAERNWDARALAADHSLARAMGGTRADRLLHSTCNGQRGDGSRDHKRPALTGQPNQTHFRSERLAMDW
ncbi:Uncharacterised protein [Mycobacteroides abscessus subsp. massiliense]|nr:Uncharacterised protein [Mycobacteroides abscessus subsp. massiliense]